MHTMRNFLTMTVAALALSGCALWNGDRASLSALIERKALELPKLSDYEMGKRYLQFRSPGLAIEAFQRELAKNPNSVPALNGLAAAYDSLGRKDVAQRFLGRALALQPDSVVTLSNLAYLNVTIGNKTVAADYAAKAHEIVINDMDMRIAQEIIQAVEKTVMLVEAPPMEPQAVAREQAGPIERLGANEWRINIPAAAATPARSSALPAPSTARQGGIPASTKLWVSNGTGRGRMAARFAGYLSENGVGVGRLRNAQNFDYRKSTIFYNADQRKAAEELARMLPVAPRLTEAKAGRGVIEIVLGADLLKFDNELRAAKRAG
jgi:tetratricopeptide (TPR) repeat protein